MSRSPACVFQRTGKDPIQAHQDNTYTWKHGRQLATYKEDGNESEDIFHFVYNADGLRVKAYNAYTTYSYIYNGSALVQMEVSNTSTGVVSNTLSFTYDAQGSPQTVTYNGTVYFYATNLQGDIVAILNASGETVVSYSYDAWGCHTSGDNGTGTLASTLGKYNPLRYRGYIYDIESGLYYLQSRYYNPEMGRFINADGVISDVGEEVLGNNSFAYCINNPVNLEDSEGAWPKWAKKLAAAAAVVVAVVAVAAVVTVVTGGTCSVVAATMVGAAKGAVAGFVSGAVSGAAEGAIRHRITTGSWEGAGDAALNGMADGALSGAVSGAIAGGMAGYSNFKANPQCFIAGTLIKAENTDTPIEDIKVGDYVWAWDEKTGDVALKEVVETYINETDELVHVFVNGEEIITTPSHPFYSPVKGWTDAVHLRAGDILVLVNGEYVVVEKVQHEILEAPVTVYNFHVEDFHTYYVSNCGVLVHNACFNPKANSSRAAKLENGSKAFLQDSGEYAGKLIARDTSRHANSAYKLFDLVNNKYVKLLGDIDVNGKMIVGKHSSNAGKLYQILGWTQIK